MKTLKRLIIGLGLAAITLTNAVAQRTALEVNAELDMTLFQRKMHFKEKVTKTLTLDYLLYLPKDYTADKTKMYPTILFLHGAGERGTNVNKVAVHGPPKLVKAGKDFPFIIISPQCPEGQVWSVETLNALLDDVEKTFRVDKTRVYLTGLSMGGYGTWALGLGFPERFAAMAPICGGGERITYLLGSRDKARGPILKTMPIWVFHGAKDTVVPLSESERMVEMLKKGGNQNVKLTVYPEAQHDSWTATYDNPELFEWFLQHKRER
jgi:predicted peptidase